MLTLYLAGGRVYYRPHREDNHRMILVRQLGPYGTARRSVTYQVLLVSRDTESPSAPDISVVGNQGTYLEGVPALTFYQTSI